jgi:hypothetical protein
MQITKQEHFKMTDFNRRKLLFTLPALIVTSHVPAQEKMAEKPVACKSKQNKFSRNKANTGGKTNANQQCFPPATPLNQLNYEATDDKAVFTDTIDWERCTYPKGVTITWQLQGTGTGKASTALWFNGTQINGSSHSLAAERLRAKQVQTFTQRLSPLEAARGRVSLIAQGAAVIDFTVQFN